MEAIEFVDSHTAGEPTRVVLSGAPSLGYGALAERRNRLMREHDAFRSAVVNEPRGSDVLVGAMLVEPEDSRCATGVIFFNNVGYLGMCGHGTMGVIATLAHIGRIQPGQHRIETPVGAVSAVLRTDGEVTVENVGSYRYRSCVEVMVPGFGSVRGDVAWGGNWFFLVDSPPIELTVANCDKLTAYARALRRALKKHEITGAEGAEIDHVELSAPTPNADSRNFVLCPGGAYDRSPCGTGTSAKLACLAAEGKLMPGQVWRQEGILGTIFEGSYRTESGSQERIIPTIAGRAHVTAQGKLILDPNDPFRYGIRV